jgi:putative phosphoesterase
VRVAALYDVHGNLPALEAVLEEVEREGVDVVVVGGDVAAGYFPAQSLEALQALGESAIWVRGNCEDELVTGTDGPLTGWPSRQLDADQLSFLGSLPLTASLEVDGLGSVLFCHTTPASNEPILTSATPEAAFRSHLAGVRENVVVAGHTHSQFVRQVEGIRYVNAGSVGMPYEAQPGAYWALLGPDVEHRRTAYDLDDAAHRIRASGFPDAEQFVRENVLEVPTAESATEFFESMARERGER